VAASKLVSTITGSWSAEQGRRRRQRVRARVGHPPGRRAQGARHRTRSCGPRTWAGRPTASCWASCPGRNAFKQRLTELGIQLDSEADVNAAFQRFKDLADRKAEIFDEDIHALVSDEALDHEKNDHYHLLSMAQRSETGERPNARVTLRVGDAERTATAEGNGPVDATLRAIESMARSGAELVLYSVNAITSGTESQGEVTVRLSRAGRIVNGVGSDPDIVVASGKAYVHALNKLESKAERVHAQQDGL
jgi:2-isopropylmalate synthase